MEIVTPTRDGRIEFLYHQNRPNWDVNCGEVNDVRVSSDKIEADVSISRDRAMKHPRYDRKRDRLMVTVSGSAGPAFQHWLNFRGRDNVSTTIGVQK